MKKCQKCNGHDSLLTHVFVDKNNYIMTESELEAFRTLHPEAKDHTFHKIVLCGLCLFELKNSNQVLRVQKTKQRMVKKASPRNRSNHYYICPFCDTANEPLRNACKQCQRVLFSTEYETKRVNKRGIMNKRAVKRTFPKQSIVMILVIGIIVFAITIYDSPDQTTVHQNLSDGIIHVSNNIKNTYTWPDGSKYEGEFNGGKPHGKGMITWPNGDRYTGDFFNGQITGYGTYEWINGAKYIGEFIEGKPHGQGVMYYPDGRSYKGQWVNGQPADSE